MCSGVSKADCLTCTYFVLNQQLLCLQPGCVHHQCVGKLACILHAMLMFNQRAQAACHIANMGGTEALHDEYQGPCHVATNQGVVLRLKLQQASQQTSQTLKSLAMQSHSCILQSCNAKYNDLTAIHISLTASQKTALLECITIKSRRKIQASMTAPDRLKGPATRRHHHQMRPQKMVQPSTRR